MFTLWNDYYSAIATCKQEKEYLLRLNITNTAVRSVFAWS